MDLTETCEELLGRCPDPPVRGNIRTAQRILTQMQALDPHSGIITPLGGKYAIWSAVWWSGVVRCYVLRRSVV